MDSDFDESGLLNLIRAAKNAPSGSKERRGIVRKILNSVCMRTLLFQLACNKRNPNQRMNWRIWRNTVVWLMQESGTITIGVDQEEEVYEEALAQTWEWFGKKFENYQPERASFVTWFNRKLYFKQKDVYAQWIEERASHQPSSIDLEINIPMDPFNLIPDSSQDPGLSAWFDQMMEAIAKWIEQQRGPLTRCHISNHPHANCYVIFSKWLPKKDVETSRWEPGCSLDEIAEELEVEPSALKRCFRQRCWPKLWEFLSGQDFC